MRLVSFTVATRAVFGVEREDILIDLLTAWPSVAPETVPSPRSLVDMLALGNAGAMLARRIVNNVFDSHSPHTEAWKYSKSTTRLLAPIPRPGKIIAVGRNYADHAAEGGLATGTIPRIFPKFPSSVIGTEESIVHPRDTAKLDFEAELAVVMGRHARRVSQASALEYVGGYTIMNDVSARDIQFSKPEQLTLAKNYRTFAPMGPCLVTADEMGDPASLHIRTWLNDHLMQSASTGEMIFNVPFLVSFLSGAMDLEPGDVICTGTPAGVGCFRDPPVFMKPGDEVRIEIDRIGVLRNVVAAETGGSPAESTVTGRV